MAQKFFHLVKRVFTLAAVVLLAGFLIPQDLSMPVTGAGGSSYHPGSFWAHPWGKSVTHKGVDIFAREGTKIGSSTFGLVIFCGPMGRGGNAVFVLGPKWRIHYYAHLREIAASPFTLIRKGGAIGTVGTTGNAAGKPAHLHYAIVTAVPYPWRIDGSVQGWKKMFYLDPVDYL
jgi:murein DD-endopeptidase MepM/ murein hydrolase activator NlpD